MLGDILYRLPSALLGKLYNRACGSIDIANIEWGQTNNRMLDIDIDNGLRALQISSLVHLGNSI